MLWASLAVTIAFVICELLFGIRARSLALISDSGHNFSDALALGLAAYAVWIARRPANAQKTFGYHRVAILTALFNASTLIVIALSILLSAFAEIRAPHPVNSGVMLWVAVVALFMNTVIAAVLHQGSATSLNVRAAFVHMVGDALSAVAVLIAALLYRFAGWTFADAGVSILIAVFIMVSSISIVREAVDVLLESTPRGLDVDKLVTAIRSVEHVREVHDLHIWTVSDGLIFLSCHVEVADSRTMEDIEAILTAINHVLQHDFGVAHATIQTEREGVCRDDGGQPLPVYCGKPGTILPHTHTH